MESTFGLISKIGHYWRGTSGTTRVVSIALFRYH
jgi:hypothetical protein